MGTDDSLEILVVPHFLVKKGHFLQHIIREFLSQKHMLSEIWNDIQDLKNTVSIISQSQVIHANKPRNVLFPVNVVFWF